MIEIDHYFFFQSELVAGILSNVLKTKKPVVLVTTKNDEAAERGIREAERLLGSRREWRAAIPIVETSSHAAVNVDHAFLLLAQMIEKSKTRLKVFICEFYVACLIQTVKLK